MGRHAVLSAFSSHRWLACPPSARLCENYEDTGSEYAQQGTDAHSLCEHKLKLSLGVETKDPTEGFAFYDEEMEECACGYAEYVLSLVEEAKQECKDPVVLIEQRLDFSRFVEESLRQVTSYAAKHEAHFMKLLTEQNEDGSKRRNAARKKELEAAEKRIAELSAIFKRLYEDSVTGRISDECFTELSADYEAEQKELKERAATLQGELSRTLEATANAEGNSADRNRNLLLFCRQGRAARHIKPDLSGSQPDRNGKIFYTSFTSLSYIRKRAGGEMHQSLYCGKSLYRVY